MNSKKKTISIILIVVSVLELIVNLLKAKRLIDDANNLPEVSE